VKEEIEQRHGRPFFQLQLKRETDTVCTSGELYMSTIAQALETSRKSRDWIVWPSALVALTCILYAPILKQLLLQWWTDPDYGHGFFVPLISGYVLWHQRSGWVKTEVKPNNFGFLAMLGSILLLLAGSLGAELFTSRFSLLVLLTGMILFLAGWKMLRSVSFSLGYLIFMIPIPVIVYNQITFPLQLLASRVATFWLELMQVPVLREGNVLILPDYSLEVVEACSGIRSLMSLIALAVAYSYFVERRLWVRFALAILMIPIAIVSNAIRIVGTGFLTYHFGPKAAEGFFHEFSGWIVFLASLILMFVCHLVLRRIGHKQP
jgi:exosortase